MTHGFYAKEVIGPDDVTFSTVWLLAGFLAFGFVAVVYNATCGFAGPSGTRWPRRPGCCLTLSPFWKSAGRPV